MKFEQVKSQWMFEVKILRRTTAEFPYSPVETRNKSLSLHEFSLGRIVFAREHMDTE
jgi:hypothetical protein